MTPRRRVIRASILLLGLAAGGSLHAAHAQNAAPGPAQTAQPTVRATAAIAHGEYLARAADCVACHSAAGGTPYAGGRAFTLPFGTMYATNITPDRDTGIGAYTDDQFVDALQHGIRADGAHLYPSMPYTSYTGMTREDALAIKAYLFSLKPVHAPPLANRLRFPFNQRWGMALWNAAFLADHRFQPDAALNQQQNRGKYLATALGHCGECHTPRNVADATESSRPLAGAVVQGWRAYNITADAHAGIGAWSDQALAAYLSTGHAEGHGAASGSMGEAVENSLRYLTPPDIAALVAYLRTTRKLSGDAASEVNSVPAAMQASAPWAPGPVSPTNQLGAHIFEGACASCHQWNGQGQQSPYAALVGSQTVNDSTGLNLTQVLLHGAKMQTTDDAVYMPSFGRAYSDQELAAVANYVIAHFGGKTGTVTPASVHKARMSQ